MPATESSSSYPLGS